MGSKGRIPAPHLCHPPPSPGLMHPDPFGPPIRPPPGGLPPFEVLPPPEVIEQKLASQHLEMKKLVTENQRLAATHVTLRHELAAAQHELQLLHAQVETTKSDKEQQTRLLKDKIARMESELQAAEPIKLELQQARGEVQTLFAARQELISKAQQLCQDLQRAHLDGQHLFPLISELESLRQEYQQCRATYNHERKLYNDHLESLQVMEKNFMTMSREVEKLRAELTGTANFDRQTSWPYGGSTQHNENDATNTYAVGQNVYGDKYNVSQGRASFPIGTNVGGVPAGASPHDGAQTLPAPYRPSYDASKLPGYDAQKGTGAPGGHRYDSQLGPSAPGFDAQRGYGLGVYEAQMGPGYVTPRGPAYDAQRAVGGYEAQRGPAYDGRAPIYNAQRGSSTEVQQGASYDATKGSNSGASFKGIAATQGPAVPFK